MKLACQELVACRDNHKEGAERYQIVTLMMSMKSLKKVIYLQAFKLAVSHFADCQFLNS